MYIILGTPYDLHLIGRGYDSNLDNSEHVHICRSNITMYSVSEREFIPTLVAREKKKRKGTKRTRRTKRTKRDNYSQKIHSDLGSNGKADSY